MDWKKLACLLAIGVMSVGCGDDDTDDPGTDPPMDLECGGADSQCLFVASTVAIGTEDASGNVPGFDIDGMVSTLDDAGGCFIEDFTSPDGTPGIDNQLAVLAPILESALGTDLETTVNDAVADGSIIILMDVKGVTSTTGAVTVDLSLGSVPDGSELMLDGTAIAAGQTFAIDMTYVNNAAGTLTDSRLSVGIDVLPLSLPIDETTTVTLMIRDARVEATLVGNPTPRLDAGLIGGSLNIDELVALAAELAPDLGEDLIRNTLEPQADLQPNAEGDCQNLSVAILFTGVEANAS